MQASFLPPSGSVWKYEEKATTGSTRGTPLEMATEVELSLSFLFRTAQLKTFRSEIKE